MLLVIILLTVVLLAFVFNPGSYVTSDIDSKTYYVLNRDDKQAASDKLARLNQKLESIINGMYYRYATDPAVRLLKSRYTGVLSERAPGGVTTGTTYNKGEEIVLCLRDPLGNFTDDNALLYVALHELAHLMTNGYDNHGPEFKKNNERLINYALLQRLYVRKRQPYCGTIVGI
jgi:hypothetical protein